MLLDHYNALDLTSSTNCSVLTMMDFKFTFVI